MTDSPVSLHRSGPPETILPSLTSEYLKALQDAVAARGTPALANLASLAPEVPSVWAALGEQAEQTGQIVEAYAYFRVGYHRGLDALRQNGWRGSGFVRWEHDSNQGFLSALDGLRRCASAIDEVHEAERCSLFLRQLDPAWPPA
jgi:hypothetical protein